MAPPMSPTTFLGVLHDGPGRDRATDVQKSQPLAGRTREAEKNLGGKTRDRQPGQHRPQTGEVRLDGDSSSPTQPNPHGGLEWVGGWARRRPTREQE